MSTQSLEIVVPEELEKAVVATGLAPDGAQSLRSAFAPHFVKFHELATSAANVPPTSPKVAGALRLEFKRLRVAAEKTRKELKEDSLRRGKAIDGINAILEYQLVPMEEAMTKIEKAAEIAEAARIEALKNSRMEELRPYQDPTLFASALGLMPEDQWTRLLAGAKAAHEAELVAAAKAKAEAEAAAKAAEEARIAKAKEEAEERARIKAENERLAKVAAEERAAREAAEKKAAAEKAAIEAKAKAEREAAELKAKKEREAAEELARKERAKVEAERAAAAKAAAEALAAAEAKAAKERAEAERLAKIERERVAAIEAKIAAAELAERQAREAEEKAARIAAAAPDREKLVALSLALSNVKFPELDTDTGKQVSDEARSRLADLLEWLNREISEMEDHATVNIQPSLF